MSLVIKGKQPNSKMCFVCGKENGFGLKSRFYELENGELLALFTPASEHQGYPGRLHGGIAAAILDETIGRAIMIPYASTVWGVTVDFSMKLKKPIPLDGEIRVLARVTRDRKKIFEGSGEILLSDGTPAITATGKYLKMAIDSITDADFVEDSWEVTEEECDPQQITL
ncbi:MAG: PaaI family thioesterase [Desulfopila sp.]|jgi:acyl-coenzyme A thioesterase PaaI-like protein|nr:PaaI family thioesterase [Desulfopila sp.]